ncbi:MAG: hypothetical protein HQ582_22155 [Planctomycetes bacterium]|nr:hypothetical protein [Planctomycetota bacterium]
MRRGQAFPSNYIGKEDLLDNPTRATIKKVVIASIDGDNNTSSDKPVIHFAEEDVKPLICNNTNWICIEGAYGPESDDWAGKVIELFHDPTVMFGKDRIGGTRIRIPEDVGGLLEYEQAITLCENAGISKDELVEALKKDGQVGYNKAKATPVVRRLLAGATSGDSGVPPDDQIPFN